MTPGPDDRRLGEGRIKTAVGERPCIVGKDGKARQVQMASRLWGFFTSATVFRRRLEKQTKPPGKMPGLPSVILDPSAVA